jgi:hypothetical protein
MTNTVWAAAVPEGSRHPGYSDVFKIIILIFLMDGNAVHRSSFEEFHEHEMSKICIGITTK